MTGTPTEEEVEAVARAMEPRLFAIFAKGYTNQNYLAERAFLNAEKVVKRTRKKATAAIIALDTLRSQRGDKV